MELPFSSSAERDERSRLPLRSTTKCGECSSTTSARGLRGSAQTRLIQQGPQALSDVELLSLLLRTRGHLPGGVRAAQLLAMYGTLRALILTDRREAVRNGLSESNYLILQAALELARRHYHEALIHQPVLSCQRLTREFLHMRMRDLPYEVFSALYLDSRYRVLHYKELFRGTIDAAVVHPREVVKDVLTHNAAAIIVAHNHPSGVAEPSQSDELITIRLKEALALINVRLVDHLIIGDGHVESFAERGLL
jgi:DNA repair protein RadC